MNPIDYQNWTGTIWTSKIAPVDPSLAHALIGIANEGGELLGLLKKMMFKERHYTDAEIMDELGDVAYYMTRALAALGSSWSELFDANHEKLTKRYNGSYSATKAAAQADKADPLSPSAWAAGFNGA